mgnify:CR=1 FL=1
MSYEHVGCLCKFMMSIPENMDICEFGVYKGDTLKTIVQEFKKANKSYRKIFAFDSWIGLPDSDENKPPEWHKGAYSSSEFFGVSPEEVPAKIEEKVGARIRFISGYFSESLNFDNYLRYGLQQASFINIDVDLYLSTIQVLEFCYLYGIMNRGTVIRYDDWAWKDGNERAHKDIIEKYNITFEQLADNIFRMV